MAARARTKAVRAKNQKPYLEAAEIEGQVQLAVAQKDSRSVRSEPIGGARLYRKGLACTHRETESPCSPGKALASASACAQLINR